MYPGVLSKSIKSSSKKAWSASSESTGLVGAELAPSGRAHCAWCDTLISVGETRAIVRFQHAAGSFSRDHGAATGYNPGGLQCEYMHPQCALQLDVNLGGRGRAAMCCMCKQSTQPGQRMKCVVGSASARCTPSKTSPFYYCYGCTGGFVDAHRSLLTGFLGAEQRRQAVAWAERGVFQSAGTVGGPQPVNATVQDMFRSSEVDEAIAVRRHVELQRIIFNKLRSDKAKRKSGSTGNPTTKRRR